MGETAVDDVLAQPPFGVEDSSKRSLFVEAIAEELRHHAHGNELFRKLLARAGCDPTEPIRDLADLPFLPMAIFKRLLLRSVPEAEIVRTLASSATTDQQPSRIPIDQVTRQRQVRAVGSVLGDVLGAERRPFVVVDADPLHPPDRYGKELQARQAALRGFLTAASQTEAVLRSGADGSLELDEERLEAVLTRWERTEEAGCLFGFTFLVQRFVTESLTRRGKKFRLPSSTVLHIGGWKALERQRVSREAFQEGLTKCLGVLPSGVIDIYGFTEQMGLIYPDCPKGRKHVPVFSEVLVREPQSLKVVPDGEEGLLQVVSSIPHRYPGISILTDDLGRIVQRGRCACGRYGTQFLISGRAQDTEVRGCGDVLASELLAEAQRH